MPGCSVHGDEPTTGGPGTEMLRNMLKVPLSWSGGVEWHWARGASGMDGMGGRLARQQPG